jgi:RimJ/RimL family protein N-acetyltransferase/ADP-ribose pyrophosphatase YjhB (NUDIX family)
VNVGRDGGDVNCVGAFIRDERNRVYVHRRSPDRRLLPGIWDIVGGHVEPGETPEQTLAREVEEETGWTLRTVEAVVAEWEWLPDERHTTDEANRFARVERDYLIDVDGDLSAPRLEEGKHDAHAWVGSDDLDLMMSGRTDGDRRLRDLVAKAVRIRLTDRLRLEPIGSEHVDDLVHLHADPVVARWFWGTWTPEQAATVAADKGQAWESAGVSKWIAYDRQTGELVGRGGCDRLAADGVLTRQIAGLLPGHAWANDRLEAGWTVAPELQRRGYAAEIGKAGLEFAFSDLGAAEVVAFTEPHNVASRAVMERLGMSYVGDISDDGLFAGADGVRRETSFAVYWLAGAYLQRDRKSTPTRSC